MIPILTRVFKVRSNFIMQTYYSYSHTNQNRLYSEASGSSFNNGATDDSHRATASLRFMHDFGKYGNITAILNGTLLSNRTGYSGTSTATDRLTAYRIGPGLFYNFTTAKFNGLIGGGFNYDHSTLGNESEHSTQPWMDFSLHMMYPPHISIQAIIATYCCQLPILLASAKGFSVATRLHSRWAHHQVS